MTATAAAVAVPQPLPSDSKSKLGWAVSDTMAIVKRNLITLKRVPQLLIFSTVQPVIFVLLFVYVFGGAIPIPGVTYVNYLMPGIFLQTVTFGAVNTGIGLADDLNKGFIERFRSLPMARSAVLAGRTVADLIRNLLVVMLMLVVGYMVGFRIQTDVLQALFAIVLLLAFAFSLAWVFAFVGLGASNAESAQAASFPIVAVLVFASPAFVPVASMPEWLQGFANHQPVGATVNAVRALMIGGPFGTETAKYVVTSLAWSILIVAIFAPLAVNKYRKTA
jgi:ABC transporter DrrB family efflux protein